MNCPYCGFRFRVLGVVGDEIPALAPIVCECCAQVGLLERGQPRQATDAELVDIRQSPAWREVLEPVIKLINAKRN